MFFYLSKALWFLATPSNALLDVVALGFLAILLGRRRLGSWVGLGALALVALIGWGPLGTFVLLPLEERFPPEPESGRPVAGIIVLGGGVESFLTAARGQLTTGEAGERLLAFADLARRFPDARLVYSGGSAAILDSRDVPEADLVRDHAETLGIAPGRILAENRSRTTWENAVETRRLVAPATGERWLLVTSAWHMPRSVGVFAAAGFPVVPYPVDYLTRGPGDPLATSVAIPVGLHRFDIGLKEWVGLVAYWLSGRTAALLPGPGSSAPISASPAAPGAVPSAIRMR